MRSRAASISASGITRATLSDAGGLRRRPQRAADDDDDRRGQEDPREGACEAGAEESPANPSEADHLQRDHDNGADQRGVVLRDQERQRMENAPDERSDTGDRAARDGAAAARQDPRVR